MTPSHTALKTLVGVVGISLMSTAVIAAGASESGGAGSQQERKVFQQQNSDKAQQGQDLVNEQRMSSQQPNMQAPEKNTGADRTGGRDSHLGPHDQQSPSGAKEMKSVELIEDAVAYLVVQ